VRILVAYASQHGATRGIAERIADQLRTAGQVADARPVTATGDLAGFDAFVIGGAAYIGRWLKEATEFVLQNRALLADRPTWLFSSGPLGTEATDDQGRDLLEISRPREFPELQDAIHPRDQRVFFGALDAGKLGFRDRAIRAMPVGRALLPDGDFRDWSEIDAWAAGIARDLTLAPAGRDVQTA